MKIQIELNPKNGIRCPACGAEHLGGPGHQLIIDSRECRGGKRRRRQCPSCSHRFSTLEFVHRFQPAVVAMNYDPILLGA